MQTSEGWEAGAPSWPFVREEVESAKRFTSSWPSKKFSSRLWGCASIKGMCSRRAGLKAQDKNCEAMTNSLSKQFSSMENYRSLINCQSIQVSKFQIENNQPLPCLTTIYIWGKMAPSCAYTPNYIQGNLVINYLM